MNYTKDEEALLKSAFQLQQEKHLNEISNDDVEKVLFTANFENKMKKLITLQKKSYYSLVNTIGKRIACIIIAVLLSVTTTVLSVDAFREPFVNYVVKSYKKYSAVTFENAPNMTEESIKNYKCLEPAYIPEGYIKTLHDKRMFSCFSEYKNENGNRFMIDQSIPHNAQLNIDTEGTVTKKIYINGEEAIYYENKGYCNVIFTQDQYAFIVFGNISKEELIKIAESIKNVE